MKKFLKQFYTLVFICFTSFVIAQSKPEIKLIAKYDANKISLRWGTTNIRVFEDIKKNGLTIKRTTTKVNGVGLTTQEKILSEVILYNALKPMSNAMYMTTFGSAEDASLVRNALYGISGDSSISLSAPKLSDAVMYNQAKEGRLFLIMFACEKNFALAKATALAYDDATVVTNNTYLYEVYPTVYNPSFITGIGSIEITASSTAQVSSIENVQALAQAKGIELRWTVKADSKYFTFDIQRSADGVTFQTITPKPFVYMSADKIDLGYISYLDSVATNMTYYYKIAGYTPFGTLSAYSSTVQAIAKNERIASFPLQIKDPTFSGSSAIVNWVMPTSMEPKITGFNVYNAPFSDEKFVKVNTTLIGKTDRSFTHPNAAPTSYYLVEAVDNDGYVYKSYPLMAQLPDSIPPARPTGLTAKYFDEKKVVVNWAANTEADLAGYRVLMSNLLGGPYIQLTDSPIKETTFTHYTDPTVIGDSIYFAIIATDVRQNYSAQSVAYGVVRPDIVPPSKPSLRKAKGTRDGVELAWEYSTTKTVAKHILERKPLGTPTWTKVLDISNANKQNYIPQPNKEYNFLDTAKLEDREYEYRLIAEEASYTQSASDFVSCVPLKSAVTKNPVSNFSIKEETETQPANLVVQKQIENLRNINIENRFTAGSVNRHHITLSFTYELDENLKEFQILRSITSGPTEKYKTITLEEAMGLDPNTQQANITGPVGPTKFTFKDKDLLTGRRYTYQVIAHHKDLTSTPRSNTLTLKVNKD